MKCQLILYTEFISDVYDKFDDTDMMYMMQFNDDLMQLVTMIIGQGGDRPVLR